MLTLTFRACAAQEAAFATLQPVFFNMDQHVTRIKPRQEPILPLSLGHRLEMSHMALVYSIAPIQAKWL